MRRSRDRVMNRLINGRSLTGEYQKKNVSLKYRYFEPGTTGSPMLVILHGISERGSDNFKQLDFTKIRFINKIRVRYSPLVLLPQCPLDNIWTINPKRPFSNFDLDSIPVSPTLEIIHEIILKLAKQYMVDMDRIYILGYSMGGTGTWEIILRYPDLFAAAVPICGASDPSSANLLKHMHIWTFSAQNDQFYDFRDTEETVTKLKELNCDIKYTLYENQGHSIWGQIFNDAEVSDWLFSKKKSESIQNLSVK